MTRSLKMQNFTKSPPFSFCTPIPCLSIICLLFVLSAHTLAFMSPIKISMPFLWCLVFGCLDLLVKLVLLSNGCHIGGSVELDDGNFSAL